MAETCIVCLGDLRSCSDELPDPPNPTTADATGDAVDPARDAKESTRILNAQSIRDDEESIAHLLPCKHDLHNACLTPWVERANSCPICRAKFNMVELSEVIGGPIIDSYAVQDKVQEAELDPSMIIEEDELFAVEAFEPCLVCGATDDTHELMYCDGCDKAVHVFCAGFDDSPDTWYCETCLVDLESDAGLPGIASAVRRRARRRATAVGHGPRRNNDAVWARVWQEVSRRLDLDLDFPFDDDSEEQRTDEQRREFARWQRRFEVAGQHGTANRLRGIASARLNSMDPIIRPAPESQEEIRAWNAFDKLRESQDAPPNIRRPKRKRTASPAPSAHEAETTTGTQQKRPRLRRPRVAVEQDQNGASSSRAGEGPAEGPTFLSSLLREVERQPISAGSGSPGPSDQQNGQLSPHGSSLASSPASSECGTPPRRLSATPPPPTSRRPLSPPLSSTIVPVSSPVDLTFSPFSPSNTIPDTKRTVLHHRGRRRAESPRGSDDDTPQDRGSSPGSLSYSAKQEIQRMVKLALGSRYRDKDVTKAQYTEINRDVSRKLYEQVGSATALSNQTEREKWQGVANEEVRKAMVALEPVTTTDEA